MSYSVIPIDRFRKEAKRLIRKYPSLKDELFELNSLLISTPFLGVPLGNNTYKIRISIKSKGGGKSGGGRVITYTVSENKEVYLLAIYDKSEMESINTTILRKIIRSIKEM